LIGLEAADAASLADDLLTQGETLQSVWRYVIIQLLDDYSHDLARSGVSVASQRFSREPARTRSTEVDAALAALAEYLARRDGWALPSWARKPGRYSSRWWFVSPLRGMHPTALQESPPVVPDQGDLHHCWRSESGMTSGPLSADDIRRLFEELASELDRNGQRAEVFLVGGAAIALCFDARRATRDLDAVFAPTDSVRRAAATVADREGLDPDWLNDAVKGFLPGPDPNAVRYFEAPGLLVDVASAEYLLAMKLFSSRVETDAEDIALLYREVGYQPECNSFLRRSSNRSTTSDEASRSGARYVLVSWALRWEVVAGHAGT